MDTWTGENLEAHVSMAKWQQSVWMFSAVEGTKFDLKHKTAQGQGQWHDSQGEKNKPLVST